MSDRKKKLVENLVVVMKTAATDCLLNYKENRDGTFICRLLGNEGDFLYHPNLQKDIETSKNDDIGNLFVVPPAEVARVKEAESKLTFEEEAPAEQVEPPKPVEEAPEATTTATTTTTTPVQPPPAPKPVAAPKKPVQTRVSYPVKISDKEYKVSAMPDEKGEIKGFFIYAAADTTFSTPLGKAQAEKVKDPKTGKDKYIPKKGTVVFDKK